MAKAASSKSKSQYVCQDCGAEHRQWSGRCGSCGAWNSLQEFKEAPAGRPSRARGYAGEPQVRLLADVEPGEMPRTLTGMDEVDRVLGGGLVAGSVTLIGGEPGIGKSTLLLQITKTLQALMAPLYVTGEESLEQVHLRAQRLGLDAGQLRLMAETSVEAILETLQRESPRLVVIDSIQTMFSEAVTSAPGSVSQVRESAAALVRHAKQTGTALILVGHVTKEGTLAGPRVLEHMVDTVLYFESDQGSRFRMVRAVKNRFGAANELGVFAMTDAGLKEVSNPSAIFLSRHESPVPGSIIMVTREGTRPLLVEVQALVDESHLGNPRRVCLGMEANRLAMLLAVLHRHGGVTTYDQDVFVNVVGGIKLTETAADLPVVLSVLSSLRDRPVSAETVVFGELGLSGEIRPIPSGEERIREASKHGFKRALVPKANAPRAGSDVGLEVVPVERLSQALDLI